jgi:hypothetical protein
MSAGNIRLCRGQYVCPRPRGLSAPPYRVIEVQLTFSAIWSIVLYGTESFTVRKVDHKCVETFEVLYWKTLGKIIWTDRVRNEVLNRVMEERNILGTMKIKKSVWVCHILRSNCPLKHVIEGKIEGRIYVKGRRRRSCNKLLNNLKEKRGHCKLNEEALARTLWGTRLGRVYGPVTRQTA